MKIAIIPNPHPKIITMISLIRECEKQAIDYYILHTGQHYSFETDRFFFDELELLVPKHDIGMGYGDL